MMTHTSRASCILFLAPVIANMCNASLQQSKLPASSKKAIVRPLLKKQTLDQNDPSSYRGSLMQGYQNTLQNTISSLFFSQPIDHFIRRRRQSPASWITAWADAQKQIKCYKL